MIRLSALFLAVAISACTSATTAFTPSPAATTAAPTFSTDPRTAPPTTASQVPACFAPPPPTYLPWGSVPAPDRVTNEKATTYVRYVGPARGTATSPYFSITRAPTSQLYPPADVPPRDVAGRQVLIFRVGDPGVGEIAARWDEGMDGCVYDAHLYLPLAGAADADEIAKVIASLDVWAAVRAQLPATVLILKPTFVPARFAERANLLSVSTDPYPHYWIAYGAGSEQLQFYLGAANSSPPNSSIAVSIRGNAGTISTTAGWPSIAAAWSESGQHYVVQATASVRQAEIFHVITELVEVR